jgi:hypothetical protein
MRNNTSSATARSKGLDRSSWNLRTRTELSNQQLASRMPILQEEALIRTRLPTIVGSNCR